MFSASGLKLFSVPARTKEKHVLCFIHLVLRPVDTNRSVLFTSFLESHFKSGNAVVASPKSSGRLAGAGWRVRPRSLIGTGEKLNRGDENME